MEAAPNRAPDDGASSRAPWFFAAFVVVSFVLAVTLSRLLEPVPPPPSEEAPPPQIAVMPFYNLAQEPGDHYLSYALADEVSTALRQNRALRVRPFEQLRSFIDRDPQSVARAVSAEWVVSGQFAVEDGELRVTLEAVHVDTNQISWREALAVPLHDIEILRRRLAMLVRVELARALGVRGAEVELDLPSNNAGYTAYLRGIAHAPRPPTNVQAIAELEQAVALDPAFASAWARLAERYFVSETATLVGEPDWTRARRSAQRAIAIQSTLVEPRALLVRIALASRDTAGALTLARALADAHPESAQAHHALSMVYRYAGLLEWSQRECDRAFGLDRYDYRFVDCSWAFMRKRRPDRAHDYLEHLDVDASAGSPASRLAAAFYPLFEPDPESSVRRFESLQDGHPFKDANVCGDASANGRSEFVASQRSLARQAFDPETTYLAAVLIAWCQDADGAVEALRIAAERGYCAVGAVVEEAPFASLRERDDAEILRNQLQACQDRFLAAHQDPDRSTVAPE